jgi:hypothetical protein
LDLLLSWHRAKITEPSPRTILDHLNNECPHCGAVFYDFDGCLALRCTCGGYFCALCFQGFANSDDVHDHVNQCTKNTSPGEYFMPIDSWMALQEQARQDIGTKLIRERTGIDNMHCARVLHEHGIVVHRCDLDIARACLQMLNTVFIAAWRRVY